MHTSGGDMDFKIKNISELIQSKVRDVCSSPVFTDWLKTIDINEEDMIVINNSFFFRYKVETNKNAQFLSLLLPGGTIDSAEFRVATGISINSDFKLFRHKSSIPTNSSLDNAVQNELQSLGRLVFILIGHFDDSVEFSQPINHSLFNEIVLNPRSALNVSINGPKIIVKDVVSEELIWNQLEIKAFENRLIADKLPDSLIKPFSNAIKQLRKNCYINLILPDREESLDNTFLDSVTNALKENVSHYQQSLDKWHGTGGEQLEFNNLLRIAYNFSGEAITILRLLVSICDLKPLILWMTMKEQIELAEAFRNLPWTRMNEKPSLDDYVGMIHGARNRSFHNLLPFNRTIMVQLDGVSIAARHLRLFPEYASTRSKNTIALDYEDRQLVEILAEFTRAEQKYISPDFWQRNLIVMIAIINLLDEVTKSLKVLNRTGI